MPTTIWEIYVEYRGVSAMHSPRLKEKYVYVIYGSFILSLTDREKEPISLEGIDTIEDLISRLDTKYPGLKEVFMPAKGGFNSRTAITLRRAGLPPISVTDQKQPIQAGDILLLW